MPALFDHLESDLQTRGDVFWRDLQFAAKLFDRGVGIVSQQEDSVRVMSAGRIGVVPDQFFKLSLGVLLALRDQVMSRAPGFESYFAVVRRNVRRQVGP